MGELYGTVVFWAVGLASRQLRRSAAAVKSHGVVFSSFISPLITTTSGPFLNISCLVFEAAEPTWQGNHVLVRTNFLLCWRLFLPVSQCGRADAEEAKMSLVQAIIKANAEACIQVQPVLSQRKCKCTQTCPVTYLWTPFSSSLGISAPWASSLLSSSDSGDKRDASRQTLCERLFYLEWRAWLTLCLHILAGLWPRYTTQQQQHESVLRNTDLNGKKNRKKSSASERSAGIAVASVGYTHVTLISVAFSSFCRFSVYV